MQICDWQLNNNLMKIIFLICLFNIISIQFVFARILLTSDHSTANRPDRYLKDHVVENQEYMTQVYSNLKNTVERIHNDIRSDKKTIVDKLERALGAIDIGSPTQIQLQQMMEENSVTPGELIHNQKLKR